jgi:prepilin-type N-terminal cleavage/methylation domain-containing protein
MTTQTRFHRQDGFSLTELLVVVGIMATTFAMAMLFTRAALTTSKADGAAKTVEGALRQAREQAISERRNMTVKLTGGNTISWYRREVAGIAETGVETLLGQTVLEGGATFQAIPSTMPDTPEGFGKGSATEFGGATALIFTSDGTFSDQSGEPLNGTVFLALPGGNRTSIRAVTIFGPTALIRRYVWDGTKWQE